MSVKEQVTLPTQGICTRCKFVSSQEVCKACVLLEGLNKGLPRLGIGKSSKAKRMLEEYNSKHVNGKNLLADAVNDLNDASLDKSNNRYKNKKSSSNTNTTCNKNKNNCCEGTGKCQNQGSTVHKNGGNQKLNTLLEQYGLEKTSNVQDTLSPESNGTYSSDNSDDEPSQYEEDDTCSSSCGKMGSLQIGF